VEPLLLKAYTAQAIVAMQDRLDDEEVSVHAKRAKFTVNVRDNIHIGLTPTPTLCTSVCIYICI